MCAATTPLRVAVLSIFPEIFTGFLASSLIAKAITKGLLNVDLINIRDFADPPHFRVDDTPYGGGAGMVMLVEPMVRAIRQAKQIHPHARVILLSASGRKFDQAAARALALSNDLILVCGRYEGVDQRVAELCVDEEISIGDFVTMGGEAPAMMMLEAVLRLRPEVLGNENSIRSESFSDECLLEAPQYSKPAEFEGLRVPEALLSGNHKRISEWRQSASLERTQRQRPDLRK